MSEPTGPACPECGTARPADGSLACSCARRASEAHRAARTAEAAAAEDFDPVRIRPFVEIGDEPAGDTDGAPSPRSLSDTGGIPASDVSEGGGQNTVPHLDEFTPLPSDTGSRTAPRRRPVLLATGVGAAAVVLLTGCFVGGLHWYDSPERDDSASGGVRVGLPDEQPTGNAPSSPDASRSAPSESPSPSASPSSESTPTASPPTPTGGTTPTATSSSTATADPTPSAPEGEAPVLRRGDRGPEVTELQLRLRQIGFYGGEADGIYDGDVENAVRSYQLTRVVLADEPGVYGAATRTSLESETAEP